AAQGAFNPFNPFNQDISGGSRIRLAEFGNRIYHNRNTAFAFTEGVTVNNIADKWNLDAKIRFSSITNQSNIRLISTSRFLRALNANDPIFNPASPSFIGTTTPYNPFGFFRNAIPTNAVPVAFATHFQRDENSSTMADAGVGLNTGELFSLPAGDVGFALGVDFRREAINQAPDSTLQAGDILGAPPAAPIERQRKIGSYFAEAEIPVFSDKHSAGFAKALSLNIAARYESFFTSSRHAFVPKIGLRWMPKDETLVFRTSWGKGFAEPSLYQLFSGKVAGLTPITDPVTGNFEPEQNVTVTGNKALQSETSKSYNLGVVWSPKGALEGFTLAVDAWQIQRSGQVLGNVGDFKVNGLDLATSYIWRTESAGRFEAGVNAIMLNRFDYQTAPTLASFNYVGQQDPRASPGDDGILKWKGQGWVGWNYHGFNTRLTANYTGGFVDFTDSDDPVGTAFKVKSTIFYDLQMSYTFFPSKSSADRTWWSDLKATAGVTNLFDKDPPFASGGGGNSNGYPGFLYTDVGRFVYFGLEKKL
ncbi:MAG: TonB-dependent receptor, partial [Opitutae bacterium]|nr:TonB-dependent receptor [Opitutae bacterium]